MKLHAGAVALLLVSVTAVGTSLVAGDAVTAESPDPRASRQLTLKDVEDFEAFDLLWLGTSFEGLPLTDVRRTVIPRRPGWPRGTNDVTFIYGSCTPGRDGRCMLPLVVQVWPACERNPASYALTPDGRPHPHEPVTVREVPAALYGEPAGSEGLEVYTEAITVVIFADRIDRLERAAQALTSPDGATAAGEALSPPVDGALAGDLVCTKEMER
jgi:hypothetical protein